MGRVWVARRRTETASNELRVRPATILERGQQVSSLRAQRLASRTFADDQKARKNRLRGCEPA